MKKVLLILSFVFIVLNVCGCDLDAVDQSLKKSLKESSKPSVNCSIDKQYADKYGYSYYIEGNCKNTGSKDYDYLQIEFICYDKSGNNLGTALDNTNNLLSSQTWKFKAMFLGSNSESVDHCVYHEITGW